ncbi:MAG: hypothetical protein ABSF28_11400 [Terracidiphilus sp.]|jgi:hypothetical protein
MNTGKRFLITTVAVGSIVLLGQQAKVEAQSNDPASSSAATSVQAKTAAPVEMKKVDGELVGKLDSKSAKTGDSVAVKTTESVKMATGTEIPKGSKLIGTVTAVEPHSADNANAQMAIRFDHAELKGGQTVPIQSVIQSVTSSSSDAADNPADNAPVVRDTPMGGASSGSNMSSSRPSGPAGSGAADQSINGMGAGQSSATGTNNAAGAVVGKLGNQPIRTTGVPGVLLASNTPSGASKLSGVFVAANSDVKLSGGTQVVLEVAPAAAQ